MKELFNLTSKDIDKEHFEELLKIVQTKYNVTVEEIIASRNQIEFNDNIYYALDMLMIDPAMWHNDNATRKDPKFDINFLNYLRTHTCQFNRLRCYIEEAASRGHLQCLRNIFKYKKYINKNDTQICALAAGDGHLDCLKYLHENGCKWDKLTCSEAALNGHLDCLIYAHKHGCPLVEDTFSSAALCGNLDILKYLYENGCPWNEDACASAMMNHNNLECLIYLHESGCPWDKYTCEYAITDGSLDCLKYAIEHGCPYNKKECIKIAKERNHIDCVEYLESL